MVEYNSNEDDENSTMNKKNIELFLKTNNDLQNNVQIIE